MSVRFETGRLTGLLEDLLEEWSTRPDPEPSDQVATFLAVGLLARGVGVLDDDGWQERGNPDDDDFTISTVTTPDGVVYRPDADASIAFITRRSLVMHAPGTAIYHLPAKRQYGMTTWCGLHIWRNPDYEPGFESSLMTIRRDSAARIARLCSVCEAHDDD